MDEILLTGSVGVLLESATADPPKPLLRGWSHLGAAVGAVLFTSVLVQQSDTAGGYDHSPSVPQIIYIFECIKRLIHGTSQRDLR